MQRRRLLMLRKESTIFGTRNVQGLAKTTNEVLVELHQLKVDLAVITETKTKG